MKKRWRTPSALPRPPNSKSQSPPHRGRKRQRANVQHFPLSLVSSASVSSSELPANTLLKRKKKKPSDSDRVKAYRKRLKVENPEKYKELRAKNRLQCRTYRANLSEEQRAQHRVKSTLRKQVQRQKKKEALEHTGSSKGMSKGTRKVDTKAVAQRAAWREQKQKQREAMSAEKRRRINEKRRQRYREKKEAEQQKGWEAAAVPHAEVVDDQTSEVEPVEGRTP